MAKSGSVSEYKGLCHRCEHRATFLEQGFGPRSECKDTGKAVCGCYCYVPVAPCTLRRRRGDKRPLAPNCLGSRIERAPEERMHLARVSTSEDSATYYWMPGGALA